MSRFGLKRGSRNDAKNLESRGDSSRKQKADDEESSNAANPKIVVQREATENVFQFQCL